MEIAHEIAFDGEKHTHWNLETPKEKQHERSHHSLLGVGKI